MKTVIIDSETLGEGLDFSCLEKFGSVSVYTGIQPEKLPDVIKDAEIIIVNKIKLNESNLKYAKKLKLICEFATGYDNIDIEYCKMAGIAVTNVKGYSTYSVAQLTVTMALHLVSHIPEYTRYVQSGEYTRSGVQNLLTPVYHELYGKTWGIVGLGNIGKQVAKCAQSLGCNILAFKRTPTDEYTCTDIDTLCKKSDIISIHTPLTDETRGLISKQRIALMKNDAIVINVARGAVADEQALSDAIMQSKLGGIGIDVYSTEPFPSDHPYAKIASYDNVCLTPHMAWGAYEARVRCLSEIVQNIDSFMQDGLRNRIDIDK
mgnify:CR=1 FL=1